MYKYTLCFIRQGNKLLMLNRAAAPAKGLWNGVGGKLESGEDAKTCVLREAYEETGITLTDVEYKGIVTWEVDSSYSSGMYVFLADLPNKYVYLTPKRVEEGILDWKEIDWLFSEGNLGAGEMIPRFLPVVLTSKECFEHNCTLVNHRLVDYRKIPISSLIDANVFADAGG